MVEHDLGQPHDSDLAEQATEREGEEAEEAITEIAAIRAAIARLDDGSYGVCVVCSDPIAPGRLAALPAAGRCITCARAGGA